MFDFVVWFNEFRIILADDVIVDEFLVAVDDGDIDVQRCCCWLRLTNGGFVAIIVFFWFKLLLRISAIFDFAVTGIPDDDEDEDDSGDGEDRGFVIILLVVFVFVVLVVVDDDDADDNAIVSLLFSLIVDRIEI